MLDPVNEEKSFGPSNVTNNNFTKEQWIFADRGDVCFKGARLLVRHWPNRDNQVNKPYADLVIMNLYIKFLDRIRAMTGFNDGKKALEIFLSQLSCALESLFNLRANEIDDHLVLAEQYANWQLKLELEAGCIKKQININASNVIPGDQSVGQASFIIEQEAMPMTQLSDDQFKEYSGINSDHCMPNIPAWFQLLHEWKKSFLKEAFRGVKKKVELSKKLGMMPVGLKQILGMPAGFLHTLNVKKINYENNEKELVLTSCRGRSGYLVPMGIPADYTGTPIDDRKSHEQERIRVAAYNYRQMVFGMLEEAFGGFCRQMGKDFYKDNQSSNSQELLPPFVLVQALLSPGLLNDPGYYMGQAWSSCCTLPDGCGNSCWSKLISSFSGCFGSKNYDGDASSILMGNSNYGSLASGDNSEVVHVNDLNQKNSSKSTGETQMLIDLRAAVRSWYESSGNSVTYCQSDESFKFSQVVWRSEVTNYRVGGHRKLLVDQKKQDEENDAIIVAVVFNGADSLFYQFLKQATQRYLKNLGNDFNKALSEVTTLLCGKM